MQAETTITPEPGAVCQQCSKRFNAKEQHVRFCSRSCAATATARPRPAIIKKCEVCHKGFLCGRKSAKRRQQRFCSQKCANAKGGKGGLGKRWTEAEDEQLRKIVADGYPDWRKASIDMGRTEAALRTRWWDKLKKGSKLLPTSIPAASVATILGVTLANVHEWIERAKILEARKSKDGWLVAPRDVRSMLYKDPDLVDLRRVSKKAFFNLMLDPKLA